jgi:hypothetical protein
MTHAAQCQGSTFFKTEIEDQMTDDRNKKQKSDWEFGIEKDTDKRPTSNFE